RGVMRILIFALITLAGCGSTAPSSGKDQTMSNQSTSASADDPKIKTLVAQIDEGGDDPNHADITPSVDQLGQLGPKVIPYLKDALDAKDEMTRLHAQRALERVLEKHFGFVAGQGWTVPDGENRYRALWIKNGNYDFQGAEAAREASIQ